MGAASAGEDEEDDSFGVSTSNGGGAGSSSDAIVQIILSFIDWICGQLRKPSDTPPESVVHALAVLLYERGVRPAVVRAGCVPLIVKQLKASGSPSSASSPSFQMLYEAGLCVWLLTFLPHACEQVRRARSLAHSLARSLARSLAHSLTPSLTQT